MTGTSENLPETPHGPDLGELRAEIDELQSIPTEELVSPTPSSAEDREPTAEPTEAIGSVDWNDPLEDAPAQD